VAASNTPGSKTPRADLPGGTVTLLFTDIEGSTQLLRRLGMGYGEVQRRHRTLLRDAFAKYDGREVDTQGDAFMVSFRRPGDAVSAAVEAQLALAGEPWPEGLEVRVRMGLHTGEPDLGPEGYVGIDVVRAARISAVAYGGQILLSQATRDLVSATGSTTLDLGAHMLRDFPRPANLHQIVAPGLERHFPPLRTLYTNNLPSVPTPIVGRVAVLAEVERLLSSDDVRLVTLTGPGGSGKSRLALEAARFSLDRFRDGVFLVSLGPISDASLVVPEIARTLGIRNPEARDPLDVVGEAVRDKEMLLVLDNFEHVAPAARDLGLLLKRAPGPIVIATSRGPLRAAGEHVVTVPALPAGEAVMLFVERARAVDPTFEPAKADTGVVRAICDRVDGLPLAIELAAARIPTLGADGLLARLDQALGVLTGGRRDAPARQRTLRATIDWSYGLLTPSQRALHSSLAVFAGGSALSSIERVCGATTDDLLGDLAALVDLNLLRRSPRPSSDPRFAMLATIREYAVQVLEHDGRLEPARSAHLRHFLSLAEEAEAGFEGDEQTAWLERMERELDNVRAALDFAFASGRTELGLRIAAALSRIWRARGHVSEARRWLAEGLAQSDGVTAEVRARALWAAARQAMAQSAGDDAKALVEQALPLFRELGWQREVVFALSELALIVLDRDVTEAQAIAEDAVSQARRLGDPRAISGALNTLASCAARGGDHERAVALQEEALTLRRALGDRLLIVDSAYNLGEAAFFQGDAPRAQSLLEEAIALAGELGERPHIAAATCLLGELALREGDLTRAGELLRKSLTMYVELEDERTCAECLCALAGVAAAEGAPEQAARLWGAADALRADAPLRAHELEIVERFGPALAAALAEARIQELRGEGANASLDTLTAAPDFSPA
jgi:predicted ATPase/class 3 adenylate cyclase